MTDTREDKHPPSSPGDDPATPDKHPSEDNDDNNESHNDDEDSKDENQRSGILEKIFTVLSCGLLLFLVGYLVYEIIQENTPPVIEVTHSKPRPRGAYTAIMITVRNAGDEAAKAVQIHGKAPVPGDDRPYEVQGSLDWLPGNSTRHVTLLFPPEVTLEELEVDVVGYEEP